MNLLEASKLIERTHVLEAVRKLRDEPDFGWLYEQTGREEPDHRYIVVEGRRYPSKAFGFFVAQIAGNTARRNNDMNVNQAVAPLRRLGYVEVKGSGAKDSHRQSEARRESYYRALARPQQTRFRNTLLNAYNGRCAITGCTIAPILEAAHVTPFRDQGEDTLANGVLLRIDLHRLFDANMLAINPDTLKPVFAESCRPHYSEQNIRPIKIPEGGPSNADFAARWKIFTK